MISRKFLFIFHRMAAATNNSEDDKFNEELHWCIEYLELKLPKAGEKQGTKPTFLIFLHTKNELYFFTARDISKAISSLRSTKNPLPKKRQVMRTSCGNYREKMQLEEKNFKMSELEIYTI